MSNYEEQARSNYFKVKDVAKYKELLEKYYLQLIERKDEGLVGFLAHDGIPSWDNETDEEIDFMLLLSKHLVKDEVAIVTGNGNEGMGYLSGFAEAINSNGRRTSISINDIYTKAIKLTKTPELVTRCEY
jgi:hypothetical protein